MTGLALPPAVLFDWDNTLIDTLPLIRDANNDIRARFGLPLWSLDETHASTQHVGREGLKVTYGDRWQEAESLFYSYIRTHHLDGLRLLAGAEALVTWLAGRNVPMGVVSNKRGEILRAEVAHLGWGRYFTAVLGPDDIGGAGKPKPDGIFAALAAADIRPALYADCWYAGDTENDMATARAAGVRPVFIENTCAAKPFELHAEGPILRFSGCAECLDYLQGLVNSSEP